MASAYPDSHIGEKNITLPIVYHRKRGIDMSPCRGVFGLEDLERAVSCDRKSCMFGGTGLWRAFV